MVSWPCPQQSGPVQLHLADQFMRLEAESISQLIRWPADHMTSWPTADFGLKMCCNSEEKIARSSQIQFNFSSRQPYSSPLSWKRKMQSMSENNKICIRVYVASKASDLTTPTPPPPPPHIFTPFSNSFNLRHITASNICLFSGVLVFEPQWRRRRSSILASSYVNKDRRSLMSDCQTFWKRLCTTV